MSKSAPGIRLRFPLFLRNAPWLALSIALNSVIFIGAMLYLLGEPAEEQSRTVLVRTAEEQMVPLAEEVKPVIKKRMPVLADSDLPFEESLGKKDFLSDAPFEGPSTNAAIGIGGGAGGAFGGRGGHRNLRATGGGFPGKGGNLRALGAAGEELPRGFNRESYDAIGEDGFSDPRKAPLSTFSIDVDTASYANVRRILREGRLPPEGAVRIEEMLNYFSYDYPAPADGQPFSVVAEVAECPWNPTHRLVHLGIQGRVIPVGDVPSRNLVFLLDVSGSMQSRDKLPLVLDAMRLLVDQLREEDRVAVVVYAGASGVVLPPTAGSSKSTIRDALSRLRAGGSTNGGEGIRLAYSLAREHFVQGGINRVILATDGDFNVGTTSRSDLEKLIEQERESGVFLTVLGVGTGNIQDSQMEMLADKGNGNYAYLDTIREAKKVLVTEVGGTLITIAKDVKIQVEFNPALVGGYRLIGYENRKLAARDFNDDQKDAGEIGAGHSVTALYEILPPGEHPETGGVDALKYQDPTVPTPASSANEILTLKLRYKQPDGERSMLLTSPLMDPGNVNLASTTTDFQFAAAVATFGLALRNSPHCPNAGFALAAELAQPALGEDPEGRRREFMELCSIAGKNRTGR